MNDTLVLPAPSIQHFVTAQDKWAREFDAFRRLLPELLKTHLGKFVAIHNGALIAQGDRRLEVALAALKQVGNVDIHVGLVSEETQPVIRSGLRREIKSPSERT